MYELAYSLFQLLGVSTVCLLWGVGVGMCIGRDIQRKRDKWSFGPDYMRSGKEPRWIIPLFKYPT